MFLKGNVKRDFDAFAEDKRRLQSQKYKEPAQNNHTPQIDIIVATPDCLTKANINGESWAQAILRKEQELSKHP